MRTARSGLLVLAFGLAAVACSSIDEDVADEVGATTTSTTTGSDESATTTTVAPAPVDEEVDEPEPEADPVAFVVRSGGLDDDFVEIVRNVEGVDGLAILRSDQLRMTASQDGDGEAVDQPPAGFVFQLEARSFEDVATLNPFSAELADALAGLAPDELALSQSSAELRRLDVGGTIDFDNGARFRVGAILSDDIAGGTEVLLTGADALVAAGGSPDARRVALVNFDGLAANLETTLRAANGGDGVSVFGGRGGDAEADAERSTLSQIAVKQIFGEFAFRPTSSGQGLEIDPDWVEANLVVADFPLLGQARCHRLFAEVLGEVLQGLVDDGLEDLIDPGAFQGCWNPRTIAGSSRLSKHAWGIAADINFGNPLDDEAGSPVHPELLRRMLDAGFVSGHVWTTPDPGHFEYRRPPLSDTDTDS